MSRPTILENHGRIGSDRMPSGAVLLASPPIEIETDVADADDDVEDCARSPIGVRDALEHALEHAEHLGDVDAAAVELARRLAADLDDVYADRKRLAAVARALEAVLAQLHLTPAARIDTAPDTREEVNPVVALRNRSADRLRDATARDAATG